MLDSRKNAVERGMETCIRWRMLLAIPLLVAWSLAQAASQPQKARVKDVATIEGIRDNQLVGYGLVVGLHGTGDSSQTIFPAQTLISALERWGSRCRRPGPTRPATCR
jgi:flagellar basal body P-ring protein FlgI